MKRGEIYFANLNPTLGNEIQKTRPVLIISNNTNNKVSDVITILPITSNILNVYPFEVFISKKDSGLTKDSKIQCHQIRTISKKRIINIEAVGYIKEIKLISVEAALKLHLSLK